MVADTVGYIKLTKFSRTTFKEFEEASSKLLSQGMSRLIFDLRDNTGGYFDQALLLCNEFLQKGDLIVYTEGRAMPRMEEYADGKGILQNIPVAILIDESSASASEIVSGAIQDQDRGVIIGRRSFGKGLVQRQVPLPDGSALRLTVARYHTPSGRVIQSPYEEGKKDEYYMQVVERYARGENFNRDSIHLADSSAVFRTLKQGRAVYGGGGIMPDIFIPQDTTFYTPFYGEILRKGLLTDYMNQYSDTHRASLLKKYPKVDQFIKKYNVSDEDIAAFLDYCAQKGVTPAEGDMQISGGQIRKYFKALIIRSIYDFNSFIQFINQDDKDILKAVEVLSGK
jgi:carboxyl-terminal processing protease